MSVRSGQTVHVSHIAGDRFAIRVGRHSLAVDEPIDGGGLDAAPTSVELFVGALASCIAHDARSYLVRRGIDECGLQVIAEFTVGGSPPRVIDVHVRLTPPATLPTGQYATFRAVAAHSAVHNTLRVQPVVSVEVDDAVVGPAAATG